MEYSRILLAVFAFTLIVFGKCRDFPCTIYRGECKAHVKQDNQTEDLSLEVSCQCKYRRDVSKNLTALYPILCPGIPNYENVPHLHHSTLRIQNCDVQEEAFPVNLLLILRRSKTFKILIEDSDQIRFNSTTREDSSPTIQVHFKNSYMNGLMKGWFTNSSDVSLKISNCTIGVIEILFLGRYTEEAKVKVEFENTFIKTVNNFAIYLPPNGTLHMNGGEIMQLEGDALRGGRDVSFQGVKIDNIMSQSINIFGLQSFRIDSCIVAQINKDAIVDQKISSFPEAEYSCDSVKIILNKFLYVHGKAFEALCRAKNLEFKNNFMNIVTSSLALKATTCGTSRNWWNSLENNGFRCHQCNSLSGDINEQVCAIYGTGWCLCEDKPNSTSFESITIDETNSKVPCRVPFNHYITNKCENTNQLSNYITQCSKYSSNIESYDARKLIPASHTSGSESLYVTLVLQYYIVLYCSTYLN